MQQPVVPPLRTPGLVAARTKGVKTFLVGPLSSGFLAALLGLSASTALADEMPMSGETPKSDPMPMSDLIPISDQTPMPDHMPMSDEPREESEVMVLPEECAQYAPPESGLDSTAGWNQVLSFAACIQDTAMASIDDPDLLADLVLQLELALAPTLQLYAAALQYGPNAVQLRATFQIGMTQVGLITRARASLAVPPDRKTNKAAARRYKKLQESLEPLLAQPAQLAWTLFSLIDQAVKEDPTLMSDEVTRNMVLASRELERSLRWSQPPTEETSKPPLLASPH